jgi:hypothetical protein
MGTRKADDDDHDHEQMERTKINGNNGIKKTKRKDKSRR